MPNHITNVIRMRTKEEKQQVLDLVKTDQREFDFEKLLPFPEELKDTSSPARPIPDEEFAKLTPEEIFDPSKPYSSRIISESMSKDYIEKYGHDNWYDWNCSNWGTKWNAYHHDESGDIEFIFDSAWSHPFPVIQSLSKRFPDIEFEVLYADEDYYGGNCGHYTILNGNIEEHDIDDEVEFSCTQVNGMDYKEYLADMEEQQKELEEDN